MKLLGWVVVVTLAGCATDAKGLVSEGVHDETACQAGAWPVAHSDPPMCESACAAREDVDRSRPCDGATNSKHAAPLKCFGTFVADGTRGCCNVDVVIDGTGAPSATDVVFYACP